MGKLPRSSPSDAVSDRSNFIPSAFRCDDVTAEVDFGVCLTDVH